MARLNNLVYGRIRIISIALDPIEKKPLFHVLPGSTTLSIGALGYNFSRKFCQNWESSQTLKLLKEQLIKSNKHTAILASIKHFIEDNSTLLPPSELVRLTLEYQIPSIAFTYNEPTINIEYAIDTMQLAKRHNILGIFISSGYESAEVIKALKPYVDGYNIDLKAGSQEFYTNLTGSIKLKRVLNPIKRLKQQGRWIEITSCI